MKKSCMILFCLLICLMTAPGVFAKGYNNNTHQAQKRLSSLGYSPGPADGMMGNQTRRAVKKFQKAKGLRVTGALDSKTLDLLLSMSSNSSPPPAQKSNTPSKPKSQKPAPMAKVKKNQDKQGSPANQGPKNGANQQKQNPMAPKP